MKSVLYCIATIVLLSVFEIANCNYGQSHCGASVGFTPNAAGGIALRSNAISKMNYFFQHFYKYWSLLLRLTQSKLCFTKWIKVI
jgi:hypothetical protein